MAKKTAKKTKAPIAARAGKFIARRGPGTAKKLGRATQAGAKGISNFASKFKEGFMEGLEEN